jgi:hypothetical protein
MKRRAVAHLQPGVDPRGTRRPGGLLSTAEIDRLLAFRPENLTEIARELRNVVVSVCPQVTERILWGALSYHDESKGGPIKGGVCQIEVQRDHVLLSFVHGVRLRDPKHVLHGDRLSKRHVVLKSYDLVPWSAVRGLVQEAAGLDPGTFGPLGPARN